MCCKLFFILLLLSFKSSGSYRNDELLRKGYMQDKVVGGVIVPITMYPHVALVKVYGKMYCGASIISNRVLVTAAHCLFNIINGTLWPVSKMTINVGSTKQGKGEVYKVCKTVPYPKYDVNNYIYDIGLISVKKQFHFGPSVQKIPIARNEKWKNKKNTFTIAGYGATMTQGFGLPENLIATRLHYVKHKVCQQTPTSLNMTMIVQRHEFCLIGQKWTSDCYGDSGSGIVWKNYLVGVVSLGRETFCGSDTIPSMYTNVVYFKKWIKSQVKKLEASKKCTKT